MSHILLNNVSVKIPVRRGVNLSSSSGKNRIHDNADGFITALNQVSISLRDGDRLGLVGLNGAGKSTLLKVMSMYYPPDTGTVDVSGKVFTLFGRNIGVNRELSGYDNIYLRGLFLGFRDEQIKEKIQTIINFSELGSDIYRPVKGYSQGMMARLSFSMLLFVKSEILLIDEGLGAGDASFIKKARQVSDDLIQNTKIVVMASHSNALLRRFCNKGALIDNGKLIYTDDLDVVLADYENKVSTGALVRNKNYSTA